MNAMLFVSSQGIPQRMTVSSPSTSTNTLSETFPWLAPASMGNEGRDTLGDAFAEFADEAREWAEATCAAVFETWPDE